MRHQRLSVGESEIYIEPQVLSASPTGEILLAGAPSYLWDQIDTLGRSQSRKNILLGVVIGRDNAVRSVPSPLDPSFLMDVRGMARDSGGWSFLLADSVPARRTAGDGAVDRRVWHGVFDGSRWTTLERIPLPAGGVIDMLNASALLQRGDTIAWAATVDLPGQGRKAIFFEHRDGGWAYEVLPTYGATNAQLAYSDRLGFVAAVVQPDRTLREDENSLFLFHRSPRWRPLRKVVAGNGRPVFHPSLTLGKMGGVLGWLALVRDSPRMRFEAKAMVGELETTNGRVLHLDSTVAEGFVYAPNPNGMHMWVIDHVLQDRERELRFVRESTLGAEVFGRLASPFTGGFNAVSRGATEILVAGPELDKTGERPALVNLILHARYDCKSHRGRRE